MKVNYSELEHRLGGNCGDSAAKWAAAFQEIVVNQGIPIDEGLMIGWFANAIECGYDKRTRDEAA